MTTVNYRSAGVDGRNIFYREADPAKAPTLLLLHGFPSAGHMFRDLISLLADRFHLVARLISRALVSRTCRPAMHAHRRGYGSIFEGERRCP